MVDDDELGATVADTDEPARMRELEQRIVGARLHQQGGHLAIGDGLTHRGSGCRAILRVLRQESAPR